jgi:hypothetical protein
MAFQQCGHFSLGTLPLSFVQRFCNTVVSLLQPSSHRGETLKVSSETEPAFLGVRTFEGFITNINFPHPKTLQRHGAGHPIPSVPYFSSTSISNVLGISPGTGGRSTGGLGRSLNASNEFDELLLDATSSGIEEDAPPSQLESVLRANAKTVSEADPIRVP